MVAAAMLLGCGSKDLTEDDLKRKEAQKEAVRQQDEALAKSIKSTTRSKGAAPKSIKGRAFSQPE